MANFTTENILDYLDKAAGNLDFPGFDNMNYDMVTARLTGFRNDRDWALTIEQVVSWYSLNGVEPVLTISGFGSRLLINEPFVTYFPVKYPLGELEDNQEEIPKSIFITIRDEQFTINSNEIERNPHLSDYIDFDLIIHLVNRYRARILASEIEFREIVPAELSQIIQLDNWHHPDVYNSNSEFYLPSRTKSMQMIAEVLVSGKPELYQPCEENNVDWRKWIIK
ncbi:DUF7003 family protein [Rivularia sp. UHCC 0363]|uniref:DUF7003 family protein n=1 Tax=Rivularia sp. UHCC 0363 TaxID=3110244 RepID=UPI002B21AC3E|nr:hypothetical protein [Rivularia sp. UHCC 0363]MEA5598467.1 hypothetical protein [Rivularia sp. UHCC 0363]